MKAIGYSVTVKNGDRISLNRTEENGRSVWHLLYCWYPGPSVADMDIAHEAWLVEGDDLNENIKLNLAKWRIDESEVGKLFLIIGGGEARII